MAKTSRASATATTTSRRVPGGVLYDPFVTTPASTPTETAAAKATPRQDWIHRKNASSLGGATGRQDRGVDHADAKTATGQDSVLARADDDHGTPRASSSSTAQDRPAAVEHEEGADAEAEVAADSYHCGECRACARPFPGEAPLDFEMRCCKSEFQHAIREVHDGMAKVRQSMLDVARALQEIAGGPQRVVRMTG